MKPMRNHNTSYIFGECTGILLTFSSHFVTLPRRLNSVHFGAIPPNIEHRTVGGESNLYSFERLQSGCDLNSSLQRGTRRGAVQGRSTQRTRGVDRGAWLDFEQPMTGLTTCWKPSRMVPIIVKTNNKAKEQMEDLNG